MKRVIRYILLVLSLGVIGFCGFVWFAESYIEEWSKTEETLSVPVVVTLEPGAPLKVFSAQLEAQRLISSGLLFQAWVRLGSTYPKFKAGRYRFEGAVAPIELVDKFIKGSIYTPSILKITFPEGYNLKQVVDRIVEQVGGSYEDLLNLGIDPSFLSEVGLEGKGLEGFLYPATYEFSTVPVGKNVLKRMVRTFFEKLPEGYEEKVNEKGLTLYEAITFASLIELETLHDDERSLISEVIWNRLNRKLPLGIDAAIIYGIKDYNGNIRRVHLDDKNNPYNTRVHLGLPPTPICSPTVKSLEAVLSPSEEGHFYYVVDADSPERRHHFSKSLKEHNRYVHKLVKKR